jgi:hypothetical protein
LTSPELEYVALFNASEESSLYEIPAELRRFLPDSPELMTLGQNAVLTLLQKGLVCLCDDAHDSDSLDRARAEAIIASESAWQVPSASVGDVYLVMTDAGVKALRKYPGLTKKQQNELTEALLYGPHGAGYPYGLLEKFVNWVSFERHAVLRKYQTSATTRFFTWGGLVLGRFTAKCLRIFRNREGR